MSAALDALFTLLASNEDLVPLMHLHASKWQWLIDWCVNNKSKPGFTSDPHGPMLDRPRRSGRNAGSGGRSSLETAWADGSAWPARGAFHSQDLSTLGRANPFSLEEDDGPDRMDEGDDDGHESTDVWGTPVQSFRATRSAAKKAATAAATKNREKADSAMLRPQAFKMYDKYVMLMRLKRGLNMFPSAFFLIS